MMALSLIGEVISQNVVDVRALPYLADWAAFYFGASAGIAISGAVILIWEKFNV